WGNQPPCPANNVVECAAPQGDRHRWPSHPEPCGNAVHQDMASIWNDVPAGRWLCFLEIGSSPPRGDASRPPCSPLAVLLDLNRPYWRHLLSRQKPAGHSACERMPWLPVIHTRAQERSLADKSNNHEHTHHLSHLSATRQPMQ